MSLASEVEEGVGAGMAISWEEGYSAPLYARICMRLGMWKWTITSEEVRASLAVLGLS